MTAHNPNLTPRTLQLFLDYANDAGNWSGTPLVGGNVGGSKEDRGNITQMKRAGLVRTFVSDGHTWLEFTAAGALYAASHGVKTDCSSQCMKDIIEAAGHTVPADYVERVALYDSILDSIMPKKPDAAPATIADKLAAAAKLSPDPMALVARALHPVQPTEPTIAIDLKAKAR